jgi:hypothetical protein
MTGLAFALEVSEFAPLRWGRRWAARPIAAALAPHPRLMSTVARVVSGLDTRYRRGAVDVGRTTHIGRYAGRRLPDSRIDPGSTRRLHHLVEPGAFTLLLFDGRAQTSATSILAETFADALIVRRVEAPARKRVDWALIRPDGYVATAGSVAEMGRATRYLERWIGDQFAAARSTL